MKGMKGMRECGAVVYGTKKKGTTSGGKKKGSKKGGKK